MNVTIAIVRQLLQWVVNSDYSNVNLMLEAECY